MKGCDQMKNTKEKVIFRKGKNEYVGEFYMAIFPNDPANRGNVCYVDLWHDKDGWTNDCYSEGDKYIISKYKIIHKNDPVVPELIDALKKLYGDIEYEVCEKIVNGMSAY